MSVRPRTRKDGTRGWEVRWRENNANRSRMFALKKDADAWDREVQRRKQLGPIAVQQLTTRGGPTLGQWVTERWAPEHAVMLADSTRNRYAEVYSVHIAPWLDYVPLGHFGAPLLSGWQAALIKAGVSPGTIHKARTLLSSVLRHAAENGAIMANPLSLVRAPRSAPRDAVQPLSPAVVERIRRAMLTPPDREIGASVPGNAPDGGTHGRRPALHRRASGMLSSCRSLPMPACDRANCVRSSWRDSARTRSS